MYTLMKNKNFALTKTIVEIESKEIELVSIRQLEPPKGKKESPPGPVRAIEGCGEIHPPLCTIHDNQFSRVCFRIVEDESVSFPMDFETTKGVIRLNDRNSLNGTDPDADRLQCESDYSRSVPDPTLSEESEDVEQSPPMIQVCLPPESFEEIVEAFRYGNSPTLITRFALHTFTFLSKDGKNAPPYSVAKDVNYISTGLKAYLADYEIRTPLSTSMDEDGPLCEPTTSPPPLVAEISSEMREPLQQINRRLGVLTSLSVLWSLYFLYTILF